MTSTPDTTTGRLVILGTGGTIAGTAARAGDNVGYTAAQRSVDELMAVVRAHLAPDLAARIEAEQVAQVDSSHIDNATWQHLAARVAAHLARPEVAGLVVTHGTDTLEETAFLLQAVLAPAKPVVMVAAMRPATALAADGPQNLLDALAVARSPQARGVVAVLAGQVHAAGRVRKVHPYRTDAFSSGDAGPLGVVEEGVLRRFGDWPAGTALGLSVLPEDPQAWPWVEIVTSHGGASPRAVQALLDAGVQGLVVAGSGNASVHPALAAGLARAEAAGVPVWRCSRCAQGAVVGPRAGPAAAMSPWQARLALQLQLLGERRA